MISNILPDSQLYIYIWKITLHILIVLSIYYASTVYDGNTHNLLLLSFIPPQSGYVSKYRRTSLFFRANKPPSFCFIISPRHLVCSNILLLWTRWIFLYMYLWTLVWLFSYDIFLEVSCCVLKRIHSDNYCQILIQKDYSTLNSHRKYMRLFPNMLTVVVLKHVHKFWHFSPSLKSWRPS